MKANIYKIADAILFSILVIFSISGLFYRIFSYMNHTITVAIAVIILLIFSAIIFYGEKYISKYSKKRQTYIILWISIVLNMLVQMLGGINSVVYPIYFVLVVLVSLSYGWLNGILSTIVICLLEGFNLIFYYRDISHPQISNFFFKSIFLFITSVIVGYISLKKIKLGKTIVNVQEKLSALETGIKTISDTKEIFDKEIFNSSLEKKQMRITRSFMTLNESLGLIVKLATDSINSYTCAIFLLNENNIGRKILKLYKISSKSQFIKENVIIENNDNLIGLCLSEKKQISIPNLSENARNTLPYYKKPEEISSFLAIPIFGYDNIEGVMCIDSKASNAFDPEQHSIFNSLGRQAAIALYHARNLDRSEDKTQELMALYEASKALSTPLSVESILNTIVTLIKGIINYDSCYIALLDENSKTLSVKISAGYERNFFKNYDINKDSLITWIRENKQPILYSGNETNSFMLNPMIVKDRVIGAIKLDSKKHEFFTEYDQELITIFVTQAAISIEHASLYEKTIHMATTDGLTSLYNHRYFQERLAVEISKTERTKSELSLILCDIDFFKVFNDTYGHLEGDSILKRIANQLKEDFKNTIIARYGGEEFAVILPYTDKQTTYKLAEKFRKNVERNFHKSIAAQDVNFTISIGIASFPADSKNQRNLIHFSDLALYRAKQTGRNRTCVFEEPLFK